MTTFASKAPPQNNNGLRWSILLIEIPIGILFFLFNFDGFMRFYARHHLVSINQSLADWIIDISYLPRSSYAMLQLSDADIFSFLFRLGLYGLGAYLVLILLLSLRKGSFSTLFSGLGGLIIGFLSVPLLAWTIFIFLALVSILFAIINFVIDLLVKLVVWLGPFLTILFYIGLTLLGLWLIVTILKSLWESYEWGAVITAILAVIVAFLWGRPILLFLLTRILQPILNILIVIASFITKILWGILGFLASILGFLASILLFIVKALFFLIIIFLGIGIIALFGHLLIDQYKAAWESGSGSKGVMAGSFSIGLAVVLIFLNCYGHFDQMAVVDGTWAAILTFANHVSPMSVFEFLIPSAYRETIQLIFSSLSYPLFNSFVLVTVLVLSYIGIIRGMFSMLKDEFRVTFIGREAAILAFGVVGGILVILAQALVPQED